MKVLVCGGRDYNNHYQMRSVLDPMDISLLIQGGARGADFLAKLYAQSRGVPMQEFKADWKKHGKVAGSIRNQQMLDEGLPDIVVAFPGGRGTADMVRRAEREGLEVIKIDI